MAALTAPVPASDGAAALAAVTALGLPGEGGDDPWQSLTGFRTWGPAQQVALLERDGERVEAKVTLLGPRDFTAQIGEAQTALGFGEAGRVTIDGRGTRADVLAHPGGVTVFLDSADHRFGFPDPTVASSEAAGGDTVIAPMPGAVKSVRAAAGDTVSTGDALVVLEAMKMEHTLTAPRDGTIAEVTVATGDQVEDGAVLIRLEDEGGNTA